MSHRSFLRALPLIAFSSPLFLFHSAINPAPASFSFRHLVLMSFLILLLTQTQMSAAGSGGAKPAASSSSNSGSRIHTLSSIAPPTASASTASAASAASAPSASAASASSATAAGAPLRDSKGNLLSAATSNSPLTSSVVKDVESINWWELSLLVPHEALRIDLDLMISSLDPKHFEPTKAWKVPQSVTKQGRNGVECDRRLHAV
jgi:hypothetical protein